MPADKKDRKKHGWLTKAYDNSEFLHSPAARTIRVLSELTEPAYRFRKHRVHNTVVFFGSARAFPLKSAQKTLKDIERQMKVSKNPSTKLKTEYTQAKQDVAMSRYYEDAVMLSEKLTRWFLELEKSEKYFKICSGGGPGIMEAANKGAELAGGKSIGFNITIPHEQFLNPYITSELRFNFHYFFIRKFWFLYYAKALVGFPGGFGTMDEVFELLTLLQTKKIQKHVPVVLFDKTFWNEIINFKALQEYGVIKPADLKLFKIIDSVDEAFKYITGRLKKLYL